MTRRCTECQSHPAVDGGRLCRDCLSDYLRKTRPASLRVMSPWAQRAMSRELPAKVYGR